jgi:hypothetical protein
LPDISKGEGVFVPLAMVATPDTQIADFWLHYLVGPAVLPKKIEYRYDGNATGTIEVRRMLDNIFQMDFDQKVYGLG